jgi:hypothetical protein
MFSKADISVHGLVLVTLLALFIFATFVIFYNWIKINNAQASQELCYIKLLNYCEEWWKRDFKEVPYNWNNQPPAGCEKPPININQPTDSNYCKTKVLGLS